MKWIYGSRGQDLHIERDKSITLPWYPWQYVTQLTVAMVMTQPKELKFNQYK